MLEGCGALKGAQNFVFLSLSHHNFRFFLLSLGGLLVEFWWCSKRLGPEMFTFGVLGLSCVPREDPQEREERKKMGVGRRKKKNEMLGGLGGGRSWGGLLPSIFVIIFVIRITTYNKN